MCVCVYNERLEKGYISWKKSRCGGCRMSSAERTCKEKETRGGISRASRSSFRTERESARARSILDASARRKSDGRYAAGGGDRPPPPRLLGEIEHAETSDTIPQRALLFQGSIGCPCRVFNAERSRIINSFVAMCSREEKAPISAPR